MGEEGRAWLRGWGAGRRWTHLRLLHAGREACRDVDAPDELLELQRDLEAVTLGLEDVVARLRHIAADEEGMRRRNAAQRGDTP